MNSIIHLLNNQDLLCSMRVTIVVGKLAFHVDKLGSTTCLLNKLILFTKSMHQLGLILLKNILNQGQLAPSLPRRCF